MIFGRELTLCPHDPPCRGLFSQCVTDWLKGPSIGSPESLRLGQLAHLALDLDPTNRHGDLTVDLQTLADSMDADDYPGSDLVRQAATLLGPERER